MARSRDPSRTSDSTRACWSFLATSRSLPNRLETHPSPALQCLSLGSWQRTSTLPASRLSRTRDDFETDLAEHLVVGYSIKRKGTTKIVPHRLRFVLLDCLAVLL